ncbi:MULTISPECIES: GNAT family N-acetyltransferase [unclassified Rhodococcus (in: high G+C Gram-positive bacteria)]|uniref:GNAT family N-acetyltransferase n=1 Tax=unclassified Rhodococcus (in: high G+C Gram-positive bacteria) TaxID=192944 RepID=UPI00117ADB69
MLNVCREVLRENHESDDYPHRWSHDPAGWSTPENMAGAWVAEHGNRIVGHVVVDEPGALAVFRLFVRPGHRGSLVGDSLVRQKRIGGASMFDVIERSSDAIELDERTRPSTTRRAQQSGDRCRCPIRSALGRSPSDPVQSRFPGRVGNTCRGSARGPLSDWRHVDHTRPDHSSTVSRMAETESERVQDGPDRYR